MWFTISSQLEVFVADQVPAAGAVGTLGFEGGQHLHLWSSVLSTVLSKGFCPPLRPVPKVAIPPSLWCSGLGGVCPVAIATQAGLSEGAARASQLAEVTAAFPPSLLFRGCSAALGLVPREPVWSGTSLSSRRPCSGFLLLSWSCLCWEQLPSLRSASASQLALHRLPWNNLSFRLGGGAGDDFSVVYQALFLRAWSSSHSTASQYMY